MPLKELVQRLQTRPFVPFRIHMDSGQVYEVRHPELVLLGKSTLVLGVPDTETQSLGVPLMDYSITLALLHVISLETVGQGAA